MHIVLMSCSYFHGPCKPSVVVAANMVAVEVKDIDEEEDLVLKLPRKPLGRSKMKSNGTNVHSKTTTTTHKERTKTKFPSSG